MCVLSVRTGRTRALAHIIIMGGANGENQASERHELERRDQYLQLRKSAPPGALRSVCTTIFGINS